MPQTATSFTPESHIWFLEHSSIESNCQSFPSRPSFPDSLWAVTLSVPGSQLLQSHHSSASAHRTPLSRLFLHFACTHASAWGWPLVNSFTFPGASLQSPHSMYSLPLASVPSLLLNCCHLMSGLKSFTLCCQVHS